MSILMYTILFVTCVCKLVFYANQCGYIYGVCGVCVCVCVCVSVCMFACVQICCEGCCHVTSSVS